MKKIGIITYFGQNYGACLQAYAVQKTCEELSSSVEIINYLPRDNREGRLWKRRFKSLLNPIKYLNSKKNSILYSSEKQRRAQRFNEFIDKYLTITKEVYTSSEEIAKAKLDHDVYTTGSDQLWNTSHHGANKVYLLDFAHPSQKRVAFSPSIARQDLHEEYKSEYKRMLSKFDSLAVREDINVDTVKRLVPEKEVHHTLDPTFLLSSYDWDQIIGKPLYDEPYIFTYLFGDLDYIDSFIKHIKEKTGLRIVAMPYNDREYNNPDIELVIDAGPLEFVNLIRNASLVIADSFHATAFAINFKKPFYTLLRQRNDDINNMNSRFYSITKMLKLENRLILPETEFPQEDILSLDFSFASKKLEAEIVKTKDYLKEAISDK